MTKLLSELEKELHAILHGDDAGVKKVDLNQHRQSYEYDEEPCDCDEEDYEEEYEEDEYEEEYIAPDLNENLDSLSQMLSGAIGILPINTEYGKYMLVEAEGYGLKDLVNAFPAYEVIPVEVAYDPHEGNTLIKGDSCRRVILAAKDENVQHRLREAADGRFVIRVTGASGCGCGATDLRDAASAVEFALKANSFLPAAMPAIGFKIFHADMRSRNMRYAEMERAEVEGELQFHKNGIHYAVEPSLLMDWYRDPEDCRIYLVQVGTRTMVNQKGIGVTNAIVPLKEIED